MEINLTEEEKALLIECLDICKTICFRVGANEEGSKMYKLIEKIYAGD